jgi:mannose-6-phosphate isomerase-like protein (cupin superfamily)
MGIKIIALVWAFAEATLFFFVSDVWLSLAEICFVLSGHLVLTVGEQDVTVTEGMAIRFNAFHEHRFDVVEDTEFLLIHHKIV